jgi:6-phosphogluconolactonase
MAGMLYSSRRSFLAKLSAVALAARTRSWANEPGGLLFAASYAKEEDGTNGGIHTFRWDADQGTLASLGLAASTPQPGFLAFSPDRRHLYAVNHVDDYHKEKSGSVTSFAVDGASGKLRRINTVSSGGASPAKIAVDFTGQAAFVANYGGGSASSYRLLRSGALSHAVSRLQYTGHGANPERQAVPHTHCTTVSPDNRYLLVNDLGLDRIYVYHFDPHTAKLTSNDPPFYEALPGSGPRNGHTPSTKLPTPSMRSHGTVSGGLSPGCRISPPFPQASQDRIRPPRSWPILPADSCTPPIAAITVSRFSPLTIATER